jgi:beta-N-acetylhexosaminidase
MLRGFGAYAAGRRAGMGEWVESVLSRVTLTQAVGQVIMAYVAKDPSETLRLVQQGKLGSVLLAPRELKSPSYALQATNHLQAVAPIPLIFAADFEAGAGQLVQRGATFLPTNMAVGATGSPACARTCGEITALEARAMGIHMPLAPVLDVNTAPTNPIINTRSYGEDPELVSRLGAAFITACREHGALCTAKHFPGHGDTQEDSHRVRPTVSHDRARLDRVELAPFREAIAAGVDAIMTSHICYPALEPDPDRPATISRAIVTDLLRGELGFEGIVITDAMAMKAIADHGDPAEAAVQAVVAGADMVIAADGAATFEALKSAVQSGTIPRERLREALVRVLSAKERLGLHEGAIVDKAGLDGVGTKDFELLAREVAEAAVTVVRKGPLPIDRAGNPTVAVIAARPPAAAQDRTARLVSEMRKRVEGARDVVVDARPTAAQAQQASQAAREADVVVFGCFPQVAAYADWSTGLPQEQVALIRALGAAGKPLVVVSFGSPYVAQHFPDVPGYVCVYGDGPVCVDAAVEVLFGETGPSGRLPVTIPVVAKYGHAESY